MHRPSFCGGRCVGIPGSAGVIPREELHRHANPHRPPPRIPQVALPCEVAAMNTPYPNYPRLQALLGAALPGLQLSTTAAEALEDALAEVHEHAPPSAFFARLRDIAHNHAADGQPWRERQFSEARGREPAEATRCLRVGVCCWPHSRHARWTMRRRSARRRWRKGCCMRWWCWPIMRVGWWRRVHALGRDGDGFVSTKVDTYQSSFIAPLDLCRPRSAPTQACACHQSARRPMLPSMMRRFSLRSPPSSRV